MPLAYLVETNGGVRVVDLTTRRTLAKTNALGQSIVSIDAEHGVSIGGTIFAPGPLPEADRFGVYFDAGGFSPQDEIRTTTERNDPTILHEPLQSIGDANHAAHTKFFGSTTAPATGVIAGPSPHP